MYSIDTMYDAMVDGVTSAPVKNERWMAMAAFWLARQQIYGQRDYWLALAAKITNEVSASDKAGILAQLSRAEADAVDAAPADWPVAPTQITNAIASWSPAPIPVDLTAYAATKRYAVETGGVAVAGTRLDTSRASQSMITGASAYVDVNPTAEIQFKAADGSFITLSAAQVQAIANAIGQHVQLSFATEATAVAGIAAGTITTTAEIDALTWPANS